MTGFFLEGGNKDDCAVKCDLGTCFIRNVKTSGYNAALTYFIAHVPIGNDIEEFCSHGTFTAFETENEKSINLPIEDTPDVAWEEDLTK